MDKIAQKRNRRERFREWVNAPAAGLEKFFNPEMTRVMNSLRQVDDNIRTLMSGEKIGTSDVDPGDKRSIKDLLKSAHSNFTKREYMAGVADLGAFHKKMNDAVAQIKKLDTDMSEIHHRFLFKDLTPEQQDRIENLKQHMSSVASEEEDDLTKTAGIMDFFVNMYSKRGRSLALWEKKYPKVVGKLRDEGAKMLNLADRLKESTFSALKEMATARATRKPDDYATAAKRINDEYLKFDSAFKGYYNGVIKPYLDKQAEWEATQKADQDTKSELAKSQVAKEVGDAGGQVVPLVPTQQTGWSPGAPSWQSVQMPGNVPGASPPFAPLPQQPQAPVEEQAPITQRDPAVVPPPQEEEAQPFALTRKPAPPIVPQPIINVGSLNPAHQAFYKSLEVLSNEDPRILARYIGKYATSIQDSDPETAINLFKIARRVKG